MRLLLDLRDTHGMTILLATHDPAIAAHADRLLRMHDGALIDDIDLAGDQPAHRARLTSPKTRNMLWLSLRPRRYRPVVNLAVCSYDSSPLRVVDRRKGDERSPLLACPSCEHRYELGPEGLHEVASTT